MKVKGSYVRIAKRQISKINIFESFIEILKNKIRSLLSEKVSLLKNFRGSQFGIYFSLLQHLFRQ